MSQGDETQTNKQNRPDGRTAAPTSKATNGKRNPASKAAAKAARTARAKDQTQGRPAEAKRTGKRQARRGKAVGKATSKSPAKKAEQRDPKRAGAESANGTDAKAKTKAKASNSRSRGSHKNRKYVAKHVRSAQEKAGKSAGRREWQSAQGSRENSDASAIPRKQPSSASVLDGGIVGRVLPVLSIVLALVSITLLYRYVFPMAAAQEASGDNQLTAPSTNEDANLASNVYQGVEDPYTYTGYFTTGNDELDQQVKAFCDSIGDPTLEARDNAKKVFDAIAQKSDYTVRAYADKPGGPEWYRVCGEQYFASAKPDEGKAGSGDYYDYASAVCWCLRYFGFSDALAVPLTNEAGTDYGKAVVVVTDISDTLCVCDPSRPYDGWMLDAYAQNLVIENIGQDTEQEEALGLNVLEVETDMSGVSATTG